MSIWSRLLRWLGAESDWPAAPAGFSGSSAARPELEAAPSIDPGLDDPRALASSTPYAAGTLVRQDQPRLSAAATRPALDEIAAALPKERSSAQLDRESSVTVILEGPEEEILWSIARRIETGRMELPTLPSTSMAMIDLANNPSVEFRDLVAQISVDPVLSSELLRIANSVVYAGEEPVDTLHAAVVRIGLRALRSMIFSVSMRGTILRSGVLSEYAEDVWRQSHSVAMTARAIAPALGFEPEKAFLLGLLQDIGKIALLAMLSKEVKDPRACTPALVGRVFQVYHQAAGAAMAKKWRLPAEFVSVAGCHHEWNDNSQFARSAALANLAHHLDLALSLDDPGLWSAAAELPALHFLAPQEPARQRILSLAQAAHSVYVAPAQGTSPGSAAAAC